MTGQPQPTIQFRHPVMPGQLHPLGYQKLTVSNTAVALTLPTPGSSGPVAVYAVIRVETQPVRWRDDSEDPTVTDGQPLNVGDTLHYAGDLAAVKFIRQGGADGTLHISYYG